MRGHVFLKKELSFNRTDQFIQIFIKENNFSNKYNPEHLSSPHAVQSSSLYELCGLL